MLSKDEFYREYGDKKPYYEYWFGEPVQKASANWSHSLLQTLLCDFLVDAGYKAAVEVELRTSDEWRPVPDVIAHRFVELPYPSSPVEVVAEVLSPSDQIGLYLGKCERYAEIGVAAIFVLDPQRQQGWHWNTARKSLDHIDNMPLPNGRSIALEAVWAELTRQLNE